MVNYILWRKHTEVINANCAAYSMQTDYSHRIGAIFCIRLCCVYIPYYNVLCDNQFKFFANWQVGAGQPSHTTGTIPICISVCLLSPIRIVDYIHRKCLA